MEIKWLIIFYKMRIFEKLRSYIFWKIDFFNGKLIENHLNDISFILNNSGNPEAELRKNKHLETILEYATKHVEFYKPYRNFTSISDFPIINKNIIRENESHFFNNFFKKEELFVESTSGSTGTPLRIYQDPEKRCRATADSIFFSKFGNFLFGTRLYYARVWNKFNKKSQIKSLIQNIKMEETSNLSDKEIIKFIKKLEKDKSTKSILIFSSSLTAIANFLVRNKIKSNAKIESIITQSESLSDWVKFEIQNRLNTTVISRYSNCENGIIAQQCITHNSEYHINTASFYVEVLNLNNDLPVDEGQLGRIIVTDLFNHSMPLIRYDTGDIAVLSNKPSCEFITPVFTRVEGRRVDFLMNTLGELVSPYVINNSMWKYTEISQYQFIQESQTHYCLKLNLKDDNFYKEEIIVDELKSYLGLNAEIKVEFVNEIPALASGKRKQVINNFSII
jgi:phenylacetate-CoA ligase